MHDHPSLEPHPDGLRLDGVDLAVVARAYGTPLFAYSATTLLQGMDRVGEALRRRGLAPALRYVARANLNDGVLAAVRTAPGVGVVACSPAEVGLLQEAGFHPSEIVFSGGFLSDRDLDAAVAADVTVALDSLSALRRYGARAGRGTNVGLRFAVGGQPSPAGLPPEALDEALQVAEEVGLRVDAVHLVGGSLGGWVGGWVGGGDERALATLADLARRVPRLRAVGLDLGDEVGREPSLDELEPWADRVARHLGPLGVPVACEVGAAIVGPAGVLLMGVTAVERRRGVTWVGVDAGMAVDPGPALYGRPVRIVLADAPDGEPAVPVTVVGPVGDPRDVWARDLALPPVEEGAILAVVPAGAYAASLASRDGLRGDFGEIVLERAPEEGEGG